MQKKHNSIANALESREDIDQYIPYTTPSELMPCSSYHASLMNQNLIPLSYHVNELIWH